jgi:hypothetical protein
MPTASIGTIDMILHRRVLATECRGRALLVASAIALSGCELHKVNAVNLSSRAVIVALATRDTSSLDTLVAAATRNSDSYPQLVALAARELAETVVDSIVFVDAEFEAVAGRPPTAHVRYQVGRPRGRLDIEIWMELDGSRWIAETVLLRE